MAGMQIGDTEEPWAKPTVDVSPPKDRGMIENAARAAAEAPIPIPGGTFMPSNLPPTVASTTPLAATSPAPNVLQAVGRYLTSNTVPGQLAGEGGISRGYDAITANAPVATPATPSAPAATVGKVSSGEGGANRGYGDNFGPGLAVNAPSPVTSVPGPISSTGGMTGHGNDLVAIRADLAARRAAEDMGQQQKIQAMQANANWASNWTAQRDAASNARLANWNAEMARTDLAGNIGGPGRDEAARLATLTAAGANNQLATADANLQKSQAGLSGTPRNYIDEFGKLQTADKERTNAESLKTTAGARLIEANARATEAGAKAGLEKEQTAGVKLSNEQHQKILDIATKMGSAKTPAEARALERQALVLAGKSGKDWKAERMGGEVRVDPVSGMPAGKDPDSVLLYNEQTGEQIVIGPQGVTKANGGPAAQKKEGDRQKDANGNIREWRGGKWVEAK